MYFDDVKTNIMKSLYPFIFISLVFLSCLDTTTKNDASIAGANHGDELVFFTKKTKKHHFVDGKTGLIVFEKEYPSNWEIVTKPIYNLDQDFPTFLYLMQNNNGMKAFNTPIHQFVSFQNQRYGHTMQQNYGVNNIRLLISPKAYIENEIKPMMELNGFKLLGERQFPEVLARIEEQKKTYGMTNLDFNLYCTEWINKDNVKALVSFNQMVLNYDSAVTMNEPMKIWNYQLGYFFAPADNYENDMKIAFQADLNQVDSQDWQKYQIQVNNFRQQQKTAQHNEQMRNNQIQFDQHQRNMRDQSAANDASHARFMDNLRGTSTSTSYASYSNHSTFIDMIREEQNVNLEGKTFKVEAGAENYWMNSEGKYIKSNNQFYDPNRDALYDNQRWNLTTKQN